MKYSFQLLVGLLILCSVQCKKETPVEEHIPLYKIPHIKSPGRVLLDARTNYLYVFDSEDNRLKNYNYAVFEARHQSEVLPTPNRIYQLALGTYKGAPEVYVSVNQDIYILDGISLEKKDSIHIGEDPNLRSINSIAPLSDDLIFVGTTNHTSPLIGKSFIVNRSTKVKTLQNTYEKEYIKFKSFVSKETNTVNVVGAGSSKYPSLKVLNKFDLTGISLKHQVDYSSIVFSPHILETNDNVDYIITSVLGSIFSKEDLSFRFGLYGAFKDLAISEDGNRIFGITIDQKQKLEFYDYATQDLLKTIELETPAEQIFVDEDELIIVYFINSKSWENTTYISKIPI